jgi:membrane-associated protease RseP (regulator of RpoE activity)
MTTQYRHRTARERAASESAQVAVARAQAHVRSAEPEVEPDVSAAPPPTPRFVPQEESTSSAAAWRRRCREIANRSTPNVPAPTSTKPPKENPMITQILVVVLALAVAFGVHEAAHALALRSYGFRLSRAGIGLPLPPTFTVFRRGEVGFTVSPWLLGAYVQARDEDEEAITALPYRDRAWYLNAGIVANLLFGFVLLAVVAVAHSRLALGLGLAAVAVALWFARRPVAAYVVPALAVPILGFMVFAMAASWARGETGAGFAGLHDLVSPGVVGAVEFAGVVSMAMGVLNALPLFGLDNGKVVDLLLHRWAPHWLVSGYRAVGVALVLGMLLLAVGSDLWAAVTAVAS